MHPLLLEKSLLAILVAPLCSGLLCCGLSQRLPRSVANIIALSCIGLSCILSCWVLWQFMDAAVSPFNKNLYTFFHLASYSAYFGIMADRLTALMIAVVTFISFLVHAYSIAYMREDDGYQRFFGYISFFTFAMLILVMSNNFVQLYFGWEGVGLISYLLIGFWFKRPSAVTANFKAFIINRVGDLGFLMGIAAIGYWFHTFDYALVFAKLPEITGQLTYILQGDGWSIINLMCVCLFIGAMAKSAQIPLHIWLPDSMEGPTPISALIHAATMVTAGIFMVVRLAPLFQQSPTISTVMLVIGATTALLMGFVGIVQTDIKRVIAYSTLSQLGYMTAALGVFAYSAAIFHLVMHAFFKALLFLAAGSVIHQMHHEQDMRNMGGLRRYMPITYVCCLIGIAALIGFPFFSGFYSKELILHAVELHKEQVGTLSSMYAYWALLAGTFVTSMYSFRLLLMTFHGKPRFGAASKAHHHSAISTGHPPNPRESSVIILAPLLVLAVASVLMGMMAIGPLVSDGGFVTKTVSFSSNWGNFSFLTGVADLPSELTEYARNGNLPWTAWSFAAENIFRLPLLFTLFGFFAAFLSWKAQKTIVPGSFIDRCKQICVSEFGLQAIWTRVLTYFCISLGRTTRVIDTYIVDGVGVQGITAVVRRAGSAMRRVQSGLLYEYAFFMIIGVVTLLAMLILFVLR